MQGFLGIDAGTQGLSVVFVDEAMNVVAVGEGGYDMVAGLAEGCYEQNPTDWESALKTAMADLRTRLSEDFEVLSIGISGQMHGEVLIDDRGNPLGSARLWCDSRNDTEGVELTKLLNVKIPKRMTVARWLWTIRNFPEKSACVSKLTTPAGWLANRLTGQWNLGIGDASGMFPIDSATLDYDQKMLAAFDRLVASQSVKPLVSLLPTVCRVGCDAGLLDGHGADLLDLPVGIPVAPAEGDQPVSLAGSLIRSAGMVSVSYGTSVCANSVGDRAFNGVSSAIDHFCAVDGKPVNMVWLRNGTTFMNSVVEMFGRAMGGDRSAGFAAMMPKLLEAAPDCGGLLALSFMDDEPGLEVDQGGTAMLIGLNPDNATPGNAVKAALLATMFNLKRGTEILDQQDFPRTELILSGGLTRTPELAQVLADVMDVPVTLLKSSEEGCAWGAALLARFRFETMQEQVTDWAEFLENQSKAGQSTYEPDPQNVPVYEAVYQRYRNLVGLQPALDQAIKFTVPELGLGD